MPSRQCAIALGSNLGAREDHLHFAAEHLREQLEHVQLSSFYETKPEGYADQPLFLNAAVVGWTNADPLDLLHVLQALEQQRGRVRTFPNAPRTLDLDLILMGDVVMTDPALTLPHPHFRERRFVLDPLAEIAPGLIDPVTRLTVGELRQLLARA